MNDKLKDTKCREGKLQALAPLANPYVPFQLNNPCRYEFRKGMARGTLFPGLDLPFMGVVNKDDQNVTPLMELQTMSFAIQEIALYLDTHTTDEEALDVYRQLQKMYQEGIKIYEEKYGPLSHCSAMEGPYKWLMDPWPWEYAKNKEA